MMRSLNRSRNDQRRDSSLFTPALDNLEKRDLLTTVALSGISVVIVPTANIDNTVNVSVVGNKVDVNANGQDWLFNKSDVLCIQYDGSATVAGTHQGFVNDTDIGGVEYGGKGVNSFTAGHKFDTIIGFGGENTINARDGYTTYIGLPGSNATFNAGSGEGAVVGMGATVAINNNAANRYHVWFM